MSNFDDLAPQDMYFKDLCEKAIKIAIKFYHNLLTIIPKPPGAMKWDLEKNKCNRAKIKE
jgi:hypothetical protein